MFFQFQCTDITKSILDAASTNTENKPSSINNPSNIISITPHEGVLKPYEKKPLYFKFSPRFSKPVKGWKNEEKLQIREDYAMFMSIHNVEGCTGINKDSKGKSSFL